MGNECERVSGFITGGSECERVSRFIIGQCSHMMLNAHMRVLISQEYHEPKTKVG